MTEEELGRRRLARWAWLAGFVGVAVVLFIAYLRMSRTYPATSDGADQALQAWDMLHGNWLLRGWTMGDVTYYSTEIPEYALVELVRGLGADVVHIGGAATYTLLVLAAGLLARGRATGRGGMIRLLAVLRHRKSLASQWYELSLVAASVLSFAAATLAVRLISDLGGYQVTPVKSATLAPLHTLPHRVVIALEGILNVYGADFFHISQNSPFGPG